MPLFVPAIQTQIVWRMIQQEKNVQTQQIKTAFFRLPRPTLPDAAIMPLHMITIQLIRMLKLARARSTALQGLTISESNMKSANLI